MGLSLKLHKKVNGFILDVEWAIEEELAVLFGFSGAGKSMTLQLIAGLMKPDRGMHPFRRAGSLRQPGRNRCPPPGPIHRLRFPEPGPVPPHDGQGNIIYGAKGLGKKERREKQKR